jgi:hypothetical protein
MREEIKVIKIYKYEELTEEQKQKVLNKLSDINVDYQWYDYIYKDAKEIGLEITEWDLYRYVCKVKMIDCAGFDIADKIMLNHGESCDTYKHAEEFMGKWSKLVEKYSDGINKSKVMEGNEDQFDYEADLLENVFLGQLAKDYFKMLQNDYEYLISREAIEETINCNEYEFTEEGEIY